MNSVYSNITFDLHQLQASIYSKQSICANSQLAQITRTPKELLKCQKLVNYHFIRFYIFVVKRIWLRHICTYLYLEKDDLFITYFEEHLKPHKHSATCCAGTE